MTTGSPPTTAASAVSDDPATDQPSNQTSTENPRVKLKLEDLNWDHSFVRELPGDSLTDITSREVLHACYSRVSPSAEVENPQLVVWSESVADILDLDPKEFERPDFPYLFSGASSLKGGLSYAQCYGGHQFGVWADQLGDGRAITLGEILNSKSERWELQLKGAGKTPYSRFADGLAVLRSSIREFLCSEAMHSLGIPTTRALSLVTTGKLVSRDMFYDGNPKDEPGAIVCRVAQSFLRFGSFQIHAKRGKEDLEIVKTLADYTIKHHFPHLESMNKSDTLSFSTGDGNSDVVDLTSNKYAAWLVEVAERTASLIAKWQGVGFTHGVLNTDNMSVLGLTIDYGPFGFLDAFDPSFTPNTTDLPGRRYCFAEQPDIGSWNIGQFGLALSTAQLINKQELNYALERYGSKFMDEYQAIMTKKVGLPRYNKELIGELLNNMAVDKVDYTNFFRLLSNIKSDSDVPDKELLVPLKAALLDIGRERKEAWTSWVKRYRAELSSSGISDEERKVSMNSVNPRYILRNYLCQSAIDMAEQGDYEEVRRLLKVMERPFDDQPGMERYARLPPAWAYRPVAAQTNVSVPVGASLTATDDAATWLSPSGDFAFGFKKIQGNDNFVLSIWYDKIPDKTIVWYPQASPVVSKGSKVELASGRGLILSDPQGREVWSSESMSDVSYGVMNDTGNFVIVDRNSSNVWESFSHPADTMLPTQVLERGGVINSKLSQTNFSRGRFQLQFLEDGNLVLKSRNVAFDFTYAAYHESKTNDPSNSSNSGSRLIFDAMGYMYILIRNGQISDVSIRNTALSHQDYYYRATLDFDGVLTMYTHPKSPTNNTSWVAIWFERGNLCSFVGGYEDSRACGFNNVCNLDTDRPNCECPQGFSLLDPNDPTGDCKPNFSPSCDASESNEDIDFIALTNVNWPLSDAMRIRSVSEQECRDNCKEDCFCVVAIYNDNNCWKKQLPLFNGRMGPSEISKALVKYRKGELPPSIPNIPTKFSREKKDQKTLITIISTILGSSVFVNVMLIGVLCLGFLMRVRKKAKKHHQSSKLANTNLPHFTYQELVKATSGFKEELGKGAFGIVYKGVIGENIVAVKKLDRVFDDGEKEFQAEVNVIARTHHKNLVQLLGYCDEGEQRLLVYEYMSSGTLARFLFKDGKPSWKQRINIALGIAKGLSYLHEECMTQVIHCDIKPQNILLDDHYNAKISDFGLAKLLKMNESRTNTGIRGTKGYVAPEWFRNTPVTVKVDVYSFGVLLLEIISCRKSVKEIESGVEYEQILTDWAWDCYQERGLDTFVEDDLEAIVDYKKLTRFVKAGLWCVQENPTQRPTMRQVIQMLEGVIDVCEPPCPFPLSVTSS